MGQLVGGAGEHDPLATIVQINPIYVNFNVSEEDVLRVRAEMRKRGMQPATSRKFPSRSACKTKRAIRTRERWTTRRRRHGIDRHANVRGCACQSATGGLLPGYFVRVRVPLVEEPGHVAGSGPRHRQPIRADAMCSSPARTTSSNSARSRSASWSRICGSSHPASEPEDRVVVSGLLVAVPGQKIEPQLRTASAGAAEKAQ